MEREEQAGGGHNAAPSEGSPRPQLRPVQPGAGVGKGRGGNGVLPPGLPQPLPLWPHRTLWQPHSRWPCCGHEPWEEEGDEEGEEEGEEPAPVGTAPEEPPSLQPGAGRKPLLGGGVRVAGARNLLVLLRPRPPAPHRQARHRATWPRRKSRHGQSRRCLALAPAQLKSRGSFCRRHSRPGWAKAGYRWFISHSVLSQGTCSLRAQGGGTQRGRRTASGPAPALAGPAQPKPGKDFLGAARQTLAPRAFPTCSEWAGTGGWAWLIQRGEPGEDAGGGRGQGAPLGAWG